MRYSRALLAALALSAAACGQSVSAPTEPAFDGHTFGSGNYTPPAGPSYDGVFGGGGHRTGEGGTTSTSTTTADSSTITAPGGGDGRGVTWGGGQ